MNKADAYDEAGRRVMERSLSPEAREVMEQAPAAGDLVSTEQAAWEVSLTVAVAKVSTYEKECERFRHKYDGTLESLRSENEGVTNRENFFLEDDLADWEFAEEALRIWKQRVEILRHAAA